MAESSGGRRPPPEHSRFRPGRSGNPSGRPKKVSSLHEDALAILGQRVSGAVAGEAVNLSGLEAQLLQLCRRALTGDKPALRLVFDLMLTVEPPAEKDRAQRRVNTERLAEKLSRLWGLQTPIVITGSDRRPTREQRAMDRRLQRIAERERALAAKVVVAR